MPVWIVELEGQMLNAFCEISCFFVVVKNEFYRWALEVLDNLKSGVRVYDTTSKICDFLQDGPKLLRTADPHFTPGSSGAITLPGVLPHHGHSLGYPPLKHNLQCLR